MAQNSQKRFIIGLVFATVGVSVIFAGLKIIGSRQEEITEDIEVEKSGQAGVAEVVTTETGELNTEIRELTEEDLEFFRMLEEAEAEEVMEGETEEAYYVQDDFEPGESGYVGESADNDQAEQSGKSMPRWQQIWSDVNITEEEKGRLRLGFMLQLQKWGAMPPEDQMAERARMESMRSRWENMSEEERDETSQRLRDRFEDWRHSGSVELPELTLD